MRQILSPLLAFALFVAASLHGFAQNSLQATRLAASTLTAFGRLPTSTESASAALQTGSISDLLHRHRESLRTDATLRSDTLAQSWQDALGRPPTAEEQRLHIDEARTYQEWMEQHSRWLAAHPEETTALLHKAYQKLFKRDAYAEEIVYWKKHDGLPYVLLLACLENWARRNQPGLMVTSGTATATYHSQYLTAVQLTPGLAAEMRAAAGQPALLDTAAPYANGRSILLPGAQSIVSAGHICFVAAGKPQSSANARSRP